MGSLSVLPLADLVDLLARRRATGSLTCERGSVRKTLHLRDGAGVGAASNDPREFLGQLLVNFGHIDEEQLSKAFRTQEETRVRLGKVLVMVGLVAPETIRDVLAIKIRETILDVFLWDAALFSFDDDPPAAVDELDAVVPLADVLREAEFRATAWQAFRAAFPSGAATLEVDAGRVPADVGPGTVDGRLLALAREGKTVDEIGVALGATEFHLYQRLYALHRQGVLRPARAPLASTAPAADAQAAAALVERARALLAQGRADGAETVAARAVELAPDADAARDVLAAAEDALLALLRAELVEPGRTPRPRVPPHEIALLRLPAADRYLLSRCDGHRTVRELVATAPLREVAVLKAVRRFAAASLVDVELARR
jgi:tetratricopeptide (TPR) repeat protein